MNKPNQDISICLLKDFSLNDLKEQLNQYQNDQIFFYILKSLNLIDGKLVQEGCGPNLEGNVITLCTCKHYMRTFPDIKPNTWIAGLSSINISKKTKFPSMLFYLTRISRVYDTQAELWNSLTEKQRSIKSASANVLGDIYQPKSTNMNFDGLNSENYEPPIEGHDHKEWFENDIIMGYKKPSKMVQGDSNLSYVWNQPKISWKGNPLGKGQRKSTIKAFFDLLEDYQ